MSWNVGRIKSETFVKDVESHARLGSTNDRALELCAMGLPPERLPLLVLADRQTAGRGRGTHRWWSADGALTFSVVLDRNQLALPADRLPIVALLAGLAVARTLVDRLPEVPIGLKWPNDVWVMGRKLGGILIETAADGPVVVGIGLNVNNSLAQAPDELQHTAASLSDITEQPWDRSDLLISVLQNLEDELKGLPEGLTQLPRRWSRFCVLQDRMVAAQMGREQTICGVCCGISASGSLILLTEHGERHVHGATTVRIIDDR
ncbi:MAG: biotin--[acetyl-CoA-carboxylase] ligase [Planctomycetes bacterium]|nr:biotin--[acetyl-CoA-carboxylase] ligase [Planctomycetota bacterium]